MLVLATALAVLWVVWEKSASIRSDQGYDAAFDAEIGQTVLEVLDKAGPPDQRGAPGQDCLVLGGASELVYELRYTRLWGSTGESVLSVIVLCVGKDSKILLKTLVQF
jgi:hypothetical protein